MRKSILVGVAALLAVSAFAQAGTIAPPAGGTAIFSDDFEGYATSAAMKTEWNYVASPQGSLVAGSGKGGGKGYMAYLGGAAPLSHSFPVQSLSDTKPIVVEFDQWDCLYTPPAGAQTSASRDTLNVRGSSNGAIFDMGIYNAVDDGAGGSSSGYSLRNLSTGAPAGTKTSWWLVGTGSNSRVQSVFDLATSTGRAYHHYKMILTASQSTFILTLSNGTTFTKVLTQTAGAGKNLDYVRLGTGVSSTGATVYDNIQIYSTPEPASMLLLGLGGLLLRRRRA